VALAGGFVPHADEAEGADFAGAAAGVDAMARANSPGDVQVFALQAIDDVPDALADDGDRPAAPESILRNDDRVMAALEPGHEVAAELVEAFAIQIGLDGERFRFEGVKRALRRFPACTRRARTALRHRQFVGSHGRRRGVGAWAPRQREGSGARESGSVRRTISSSATRCGTPSMFTKASTQKWWSVFPPA
jgi:hypothetical protein